MATEVCTLLLPAGRARFCSNNERHYFMKLRTVPTIVHVHIICASRNAQITRYMARPANIVFP